ncbi:uncharacterized protein KGF55_003113 [Candida pseudojiufengensis]|uniref:uncharacterized protein n=1 Tax=Candida pseudojiufengensis TaxID=497109 RepID=UPI002224933E|nr:uncharacterized protein KGF55_003113 [Candida pseudojiufengensis]KAI5963321.1 hypothetical protein KGF55_003113 [Candida pseudojiufengensis]
MSPPLVLFSIGNPGPQNRHSAGHMMLKLLIENTSNVKQLISKSTYSITNNSDKSIYFIKSNTYMNESSKAMEKFLAVENIPQGSLILILYDDFETNLPNIKLSNLKKNESHNGIKSLQKFTNDNTSRYNWLKLGISIGPKPVNASKEIMSSWVLSPFTLEQKQLFMNKSLDLCLFYLTEIIEKFNESEDGQLGDIGKLDVRIRKMYKQFNPDD